MRPDRNRPTLVDRILPGRLGSRLALTVLLTNLALALVAGVALWVGLLYSRPLFVDNRAHEVISVFEVSISHQATAVSASLVPFAGATRIDAALETGEMPDDLTDTLETYADLTDSAAVVLFDLDAQTVYEFGDARAVARLREALPAIRDAGGSGLLRVNGTPMVVAALDVFGTRGRASESRGWIVAAKPLDLYDVKLKGTTAVSGLVVGLVPDDGNARRLSGTPFGTVWVSGGDREFRLDAELPGLDGQAAGRLSHTGPIAFDNALLPIGVWILVAVTAMLSAGVGLGLLVARTVSRPIVSLAQQIDRYAEEVADGRATSMPRDSRLPDEIAGLVDAFDRTLLELAERERALTEANAETMVAQDALTIAVRDSREGKVLVRDGLIRLVNPAGSSHLGLGQDRVGLPVLDVLSEIPARDDAGEAVDPADLVLRPPDRPQTLQVTLPHRPARWIEVHVVNHGGDADTALITTRDVTEQRRLDGLRDEIVGLVSHDLRAPLTVITGYLDLLGRSLDDESRQRAVSSARNSADRMQGLLEDLLAATRAEEVLTPSEFAPVSLRELADEVVVSHQHTSKHRLRLVATEECTVMGEERRLRQVLVNLVTNAIKYSPEHTTITVTVGCDESTASIAVEDEGMGVPPEKREAVFERFSRLESEDGADRPGVGLGLYIVRTIVERHGGSVTVEDREDRSGAQFVVRLPLARNGADTPAP